MGIRFLLDLLYFNIKVETPITVHLRDSTLDMEKYKMVQNNSVYEDKNQEDCKKKQNKQLYKQTE